MGTSWGMWHEPCTHPAAPLVSQGWRKVLGCLQPCPGWEGPAEASVSAGLSPSQFLQPGVILPSESSARFLLEIGSGCGSGGCGRQLSQKEKGDDDSKGSGLGGASLPAPLAGAPGEEVSPLLSGLSLSPGVCPCWSWAFPPLCQGSGDPGSVPLLGYSRREGWVGTGQGTGVLLGKKAPLPWVLWDDAPAGSPRASFPLSHALGDAGSLHLPAPSW